MKTTESIRCKECGHRVMYKPRTHRSEYFVQVVWEDADYLVVCLVTHLFRLTLANSQVQFEAR
jgi:DNA-directed RNA polymerase subunit RPC12/RpoP